MAHSHTNNLTDFLQQIALDDMSTTTIKKQEGEHSLESITPYAAHILENAGSSRSITSPHTNATSNAQTPLKAVERNPPTLLTIPQELRNAIFTLVYKTANTGDYIDLHLVTTQRAGVRSYQAPPTKDTLLICKELHNELREMQAAAFRRYFTTQKFLIHDSPSQFEKLYLTVVRNSDVQHIHHFIIWALQSKRRKHMVHFGFETETGWKIRHEKLKRDILSERFWRVVSSSRKEEVERRSKLLLEQSRQFYEGYEVGGGFQDAVAISPAAGQGCAIRELNMLSSAMRKEMLDI